MLQQLHTQFAIAALLLAPAAALGGVAQFDNTVPVLDVNGAQVDAHDGMIVQFDAPHGLYWRYSIEYGNYSEVGHLRSNGGGWDRRAGGALAVAVTVAVAVAAASGVTATLRGAP